MRICPRIEGEYWCNRYLEQSQEWCISNDVYGMVSAMTSRARLLRNLGAALTLLSIGSASNLAVAGDKTWDGFANTNWDTTSLNFGGTAWNNAAGDGAIFNGFGLGNVNIPGAINLDSLNITANGYNFNGAGSLNVVAGSSTLSTGVINVASGTTKIDVPITSTQTAIQKIGGGILELSQPLNVTGSFPATTNNILSANLIIGTTSWNPSVTAGTVKISNASVLPSNIKVLIGSSGAVGASSPYLDIGANNVTISDLYFVNQNASGAWNTAVNANNGVIGTGTLRVTGEIHVIGQGSFTSGNTIASNLDLGGGTQIVRIGVLSQFSLNSGLMFTGSLSNGSLTKALGYTTAGAYGSSDGLSLFANNTYTGATILNSGTNIATGTNASTSIKIAGQAGPGGSVFALQGANGSFLSATTIDAVSGGAFILDNNAATGASGNNAPNVPAAQNNNRIRDDATITLRDGNFFYRGFAGSTTGSETYGSLNATGGHNIVNITPNNLGAASITAVGDLVLDSRSTMQFTTQTVGTGNSGNTLGGNARAFFNGTVPAATGGIIPRIFGTSDFVRYDAVTGITPLASGDYSSTLSAGSNVNLIANTGTSGSVSINALKATGTVATTINTGDTLTVASGMMLATGTHTINGPGTLAFGNTPGVIFGSTTFASGSVVTGTQGLLQSTGTLTLAGDLSGLTGAISNIGTGTTALNTNTFTGDIEVRRGTLNIGVTNLTGSNPIILGVSGNEVDLFPSNPTLSISSAGNGAVISRPIIVNNGATNSAGFSLDRFSYLPMLQPLGNTTGSQTVASDITLVTSLNFQGGGGGSTGAAGSTFFTGNITGAGTFVFANGRATFSGSYTNDKGFVINSSGFTSIITFAGTGGTGPIVFNGGSNSTSGFAYTTAANLNSGPITIQNASTNAPTIRILGNSSINNVINLNGSVIAEVSPAITATWAGVLNGNSTLTKTGTGTLVLSNNSNTQTGPVTVNAGTLAVNGNLASSTNAVAVNSTGRLGGSGTIARSVTVNSGGTLAPGNSPGMLTIDGNLTLASGSAFNVELNGTTIGTGYDNITVTGASRAVTITGSSLVATTTLSPPSPSDLMFVMILSDSSSILTGNFAGIAPNGFVNVVGSGSELYSAQVSYTGDSGTNALTGGNDIVLYNFAAVPEPTTIAFFGMLGAGAAGGWYYRRQRLNKQLDAKLKRS